MTTFSSREALAKLTAIKPNDGWSIEREQVSPSSHITMRLLRRNVPLSDTPFLDIHYDLSQHAVVGVLTDDGSSCQVLVDTTTGKPASSNKIKIVSCKGSYKYKPLPMQSTSRATTTANMTPPGTADLSSQDKKLLEDYVKQALIVVAALVILKVLVSTMLIVVALPLLYIYLLSTCPPMESFDAKQQLKRVLRGYHLDDADPRKPKGILEEWTARLTATVTTELATLPGYTVEMLPLANALVWTSVSVPTANLQCYWIGANHRWYYIGSRELDSSATARPHQD